MPKRYLVYAQDETRPDGWAEVGKFGNLEKAVSFADDRERLDPGRFNSKNLYREYHCIERVG